MPDPNRPASAPPIRKLTAAEESSLRAARFEVNAGRVARVGRELGDLVEAYSVRWLGEPTAELAKPEMLMLIDMILAPQG